MKAFFSSIIKPKDKPQTTAAATPPAAGTLAAPANAAGNALAPSSGEAIAAPAAAGSSSLATSAAVSSSPAKAVDSTTTTSARKSSGALVASPPGAPDSLLTPPPASASTRAQDKKHARIALDEYVTLVGALFDHSLPVKRETEHFLDNMESWVGRDAAAELPKVAATAKAVNIDLPMVRERGTLTLSEVHASLQSTLTIGRAFLGLSATKDAQRKAHTLPSMARLTALREKLDRDLVEAKRAQHEMYVGEYAKMAEKYGRNVDGTVKAKLPQPMATPVLEDAPTTTAATNAASAAPAAAPLLATADVAPPPSGAISAAADAAPASSAPAVSATAAAEATPSIAPSPTDSPEPTTTADAPAEPETNAAVSTTADKEKKKKKEAPKAKRY